MKVINLKNYGVVVFNTELTKEAILKLKRHMPETLKLKDEEGNDTFALSFAETASINEYGISFNKEDSDGKALMTVQGTMENDEIAEKFAKIIINANIVEHNALEAYAQLNQNLMEVANSIENPLEGGNA